MKLIIEIEMDTPAFGEDSGTRGQQVHAILQNYIPGMLEEGTFKHLVDRDYNSVGFLQVR